MDTSSLLKKQLKTETKTKKHVKRLSVNNKSIPFWAVVDNAEPAVPISFTTCREEAIQALDQYLYLKHYKHFRTWCPLHGYDIDHAKAWLEYSRSLAVDTFNDGKPRYTIIQIDYEPNILASLLRLYHHCTPMGCTFDTDEEFMEQSAYMSEKSLRVEKGEDKFTPIEEALNLLFEDIEKENCAAAACDEKHCTSHPSNTSPSHDA